MSIKLNHFIELFRVEQETDPDGFPVERDVLLASVRAYREDRYGSETWKNRSLFLRQRRFLESERFPASHSIPAASW